MKALKTAGRKKSRGGPSTTSSPTSREDHLATAYQIGKKLNEFDWWGQQAYLSQSSEASAYAVSLLSAIAEEIRTLLPEAVATDTGDMIQGLALSFRGRVESESLMYALEAARASLGDGVDFAERVIDERQAFLVIQGFRNLQKELVSQISAKFDSDMQSAVRLGAAVDQGMRPPMAYRHMQVTNHMTGLGDGLVVAGEARPDPDWFHSVISSWRVVFAESCPIRELPIWTLSSFQAGLANAKTCYDSLDREASQSFACGSKNRALREDIEINGNALTVRYNGKTAEFGALEKPFAIFMRIRASTVPQKASELAVNFEMELATLYKHVSDINTRLRRIGLEVKSAGKRKGYELVPYSEKMCSSTTRY